MDSQFDQGWEAGYAACLARIESDECKAIIKQAVEDRLDFFHRKGHLGSKRDDFKFGQRMTYLTGNISITGIAFVVHGRVRRFMTGVSKR